MMPIPQPEPQKQHKGEPTIITGSKKGTTKGTNSLRDVLRRKNKERSQ